LSVPQRTVAARSIDRMDTGRCLLRYADVRVLTLSRRKQGFESPRERQRNQTLMSVSLAGQPIFSKFSPNSEFAAPWLGTLSAIGRRLGCSRRNTRMAPRGCVGPDKDGTIVVDLRHLEPEKLARPVSRIASQYGPPAGLGCHLRSSGAPTLPPLLGACRRCPRWRLPKYVPGSDVQRCPRATDPVTSATAVRAPVLRPAVKRSQGRPRSRQ
jgi:hypothetical protein